MVSVIDGESCRKSSSSNVDCRPCLRKEILQWDFFCRKKSSVNKHILICVPNFDYWKNFFLWKKYRKWIQIYFLCTGMVSPNLPSYLNCQIHFKKTYLNLPYRELNQGPLAHESITLPLSHGSIIIKGGKFKYLTGLHFFVFLLHFRVKCIKSII